MPLLVRRYLAALALPLALLAPGLDPAGAAGGDVHGNDGHVYPNATPVVVGRHGDLFFGPDFDQACVHGPRIKSGFKSLAKLARIISRSGRRVIFTIAPNKSTVNTQNLPQGRLPQGSCDSDGLRAQADVLDHFPANSYLPLRQPLLAARRTERVYWRTDPHWTTVGGAIFSKAVARALDPALARRQHQVDTSMTIWGLLNQVLGDPALETERSLVPAPDARVTTDPGSTPWTSMPDLVFDHAWTTRGRPAWKGHTVVIGDSFAQYALATMRPVFKHGRFLWIGHVTPDTMIDAIRDSNTVVIEVAQFLVHGNPITTPAFLAAVRAAV